MAFKELISRPSFENETIKNCNQVMIYALVAAVFINRIRCG